MHSLESKPTISPTVTSRIIIEFNPVLFRVIPLYDGGRLECRRFIFKRIRKFIIRY